MGREAHCTCRWGDREGRVTALLESSELILRGDIRVRAALHTFEHVRARADKLEFTVAGERVALKLGESCARRWADAIAAPPPTLARKLGIDSATRLHFTGSIDDDALREALANAAAIDVSVGEADLAIIRTDDRFALLRWVDAAAAFDAAIPPTWIVYIKGRGAPLGESSVRELMREHAFIDTKVAAVSQRLTALRFAQRR